MKKEIMEYPFKLSLPKIGIPSLYLERTTVAWSLCRVLDRSMKQNYQADVEIMICNDIKGLERK